MKSRKSAFAIGMLAISLLLSSISAFADSHRHQGVSKYA